ncbi:MAG: hypothetical protein GY750_17830 [Lentisphaerae bacterium]|nr:hypothetical protein [Lentisphaerota bacterium]MCP4103258.1 hypothetical protein [Lentisphaerota bacterium]
MTYVFRALHDQRSAAGPRPGDPVRPEAHATIRTAHDCGEMVGYIAVSCTY